LLLIRELVASGHWIASGKVSRALQNGDFEDADLECAVAAGRVQKREKDELGQAVDSSKYVIFGRARSGRPFYVVGKILRDERGPFFRFITAHEAE
jgi:hypothetical protein